MLTLAEIKELRRQHLLEFFSWRFGTPNFVVPLAYCCGLTAPTIRAFKRGLVSFDALQTIEEAALHLGFRPPRLLNKSGKFTKPRSMRLPRWSDAAVRIRFSQWRRQTRDGYGKAERKPHKTKKALFKSDRAFSAGPSPAQCGTNCGTPAERPEKPSVGNTPLSP
jgi:hypothetical protein